MRWRKRARIESGSEANTGQLGRESRAGLLEVLEQCNSKGLIRINPKSFSW